MSKPAAGHRVRIVEPGELGSATSWIVALTPHVIDADVDVPSDAVQVHVGMRFDREAPPHDVLMRLERSERWRSNRDGRVDVGIDVRCIVDGDEVASALWVCRGTAGAAPDVGVRSMPRMPAPPAVVGESVASVRISRADVASYAERTGALHELHVDVDACRRLGYDDVVAQGALHIDAIVQAAQLRAGRIDTWFLAATTAAAHCELRVDDSVWTVHDGGTLAALAVVNA